MKIKGTKTILPQNQSPSKSVGAAVPTAPMLTRSLYFTVLFTYLLFGIFGHKFIEEKKDVIDVVILI